MSSPLHSCPLLSLCFHPLRMDVNNLRHNSGSCICSTTQAKCVHARKTVCATQHLEVAVVGGRRVGLPITLKLLSCCALAWPQLSHLLLTCMTSPTPDGAPPGTPAARAPDPRRGRDGTGSQQPSHSSAPGTQAQPQQDQRQRQQLPAPAGGGQAGVGVGTAVQGLGWFVQPECLGEVLFWDT